MTKASENLTTEIGDRVTKFLSELAKEGDRSAVVLGAARLDLAIEQLLKRVMAYHAGGSDNLFDPDRPLGTFSAKIALAYRLNLIDREMEHALQMIRKIRNDFAHSVIKGSLNESHHRNRINELAKQTQKAGDSHAGVYNHLFLQTNYGELSNFCAAVAVILVKLEVAEAMNQQLKPLYVARLFQPDSAT